MSMDISQNLLMETVYQIISTYVLATALQLLYYEHLKLELHESILIEQLHSWMRLRVTGRLLLSYTKPLLLPA